MMLGKDVSDLSTTAATAAAQGLSIVVPVYNEASGLALLHGRLIALAKALRQRYGLACEVVYVDDGSTDATLAIARGLGADALDVQVVSLSRNFGKEAALMAGLDHARRGAVMFMDGDGQHPPDLVEQLVSHWIDGGYDVVYTAKAHRDNESFPRRLAVHGFYALINWGARQKIPEDAGDFRLLSPRAVAALRQLPERNRFFKGLASWIGFRQIRVDYEPAPRAHGITTFSAGRLIGLSIEGLTSFSVAPLRFARHRGLPVRAFDPVGNLDHWKVGPGLSFAGGRPDDDRRRAAHHDRHRRRIYRQDSFRAEGASDLFRRRAQRQARRGGKGREHQ
jgi:polyisoprenyl-phosphate glycosyltransferase